MGHAQAQRMPNLETMTTLQLCLLAGIPSVFIVLAWLDTRRHLRGLGRQVQEMIAELRKRHKDEKDDPTHRQFRIVRSIGNRK